MKNIERAKEIFISNYCSHFILYCENEDIYQEYESYGIDKDTEIEWTRDYINKKLMSMTNINASDNMTDIYILQVYINTTIL